MFLIIGATFAAFFLWRAVGAKLEAKNRAQSGVINQVVAVTAFIGGVLAGSKLASALPLPWPQHPALSIIVMGTVPQLAIGAVAGFLVWAVVAALPVAPPTRTQRTDNPFDPG